MRFGDPNFSYGIAEAQTVGHVVLRVANSTVLPLRLGDFSKTVSSYIEELHNLADNARAHASALGELLNSGAYELASDPEHPVGAPMREAEVPYLDFTPIDNALMRLGKTTARYDQAYGQLAEMGFGLGTTRSAAVAHRCAVLRRR